MAQRVKDVRASPRHPATQEERYLSAFHRFEKNGSAQDPSWLRDLRRAAISRFAELGFPTARRGNEEWKYTDVGPIARTPLQPLVTAGAKRPRPRDLGRFAVGRPRGSGLVFRDGMYAGPLSPRSSPPAGVSVLNIAEAMATRPDLLERHLARHADFDTHAFAALNTAFVHNGAFVHIPDGALVEEPIQLLFLSTAEARASASNPRVLIAAGAGSVATIIEYYAGLSDGQSLTNAVTEVVVGEDATLTHYRLQRQGEEVFHIATTQVVQDRDSTYSSFCLDLGGGLTRNNLNVLLGDEGAACTLNGLYIVHRSQHVDNQVLIDHARPHTHSRELYKGIMDDASRAVFNGCILVRKGAQKIDSRQDNKNLLLSDRAEANTKPQFLIYSDDVKCAHGAACGQLDDSALLYLQSRGLEEQAARRLLIRAFAAEVVGSIANQAVRKHVDELAMAKLEEGSAHEGTAA